MFVTAADKASEKLIIDCIHEKFPEHGIISEESGPDHSEREWRWVIDPLDGTTNFSQGLPVFSVSIAVEHNGESVVGVVYAPYLGELFHAIKGEAHSLNGKPICCSSKQRMSEAVVATGMPYDKMSNPDNNLREVAKIAPLVFNIIDNLDAKLSKKRLNLQSVREYVNLKNYIIRQVLVRPKCRSTSSSHFDVCFYHSLKFYKSY